MRKLQRNVGSNNHFVVNNKNLNLIFLKFYQIYLKITSIFRLLQALGYVFLKCSRHNKQKKFWGFAVGNL